MAATVVSKSKQEPYASNWLERLRQIKRIQSKTVEERPQARNYHHSGLEYVNNMNSNIQDFTEYT
ncbi:unnamed protein product [Nesidiocoris tenuis]|uniref:Uncharacterized protein n=1 Tax=Nesidiocoris tenuis TaxID=355587 RepID=A0A6H5HKC2_9HEMI|nr:unnamed protein product [Nesidiocoris tenuis]CAB0017612.1 unnamed protein product [Nesidiocoris tenuis]